MFQQFTRRSFLQGAAAAATAPLILSRGASAIAANERLAVGVIGVGTMGRGHLGGLLGNGGVEVVAVSDVVRERRDSAVEMIQKRYADRVKSGTYSGAKSSIDFRELLALPGLDAVLIATPDHWHMIPCVLAARAGKHIYCEKPLTHNVAEGRRIVDEVRKTKVVFQTGESIRRTITARIGSIVFAQEKRPSALLKRDIVRRRSVTWGISGTGSAAS